MGRPNQPPACCGSTGSSVTSSGSSVPSTGSSITSLGSSVTGSGSSVPSSGSSITSSGSPVTGSGSPNLRLFCGLKPHELENCQPMCSVLCNQRSYSDVLEENTPAAGQ